MLSCWKNASALLNFRLALLSTIIISTWFYFKMNNYASVTIQRTESKLDFRGSWKQWQVIPESYLSSLLPCERKSIEDGFINSTCGQEQENFSMFRAGLGHQKGCKQRNFSTKFFPEWLRKKRKHTTESASIELLRLLRGKTKCFVGDSITLQFFAAFANSLRRQALLNPELHLSR